MPTVGDPGEEEDAYDDGDGDGDDHYQDYDDDHDGDDHGDDHDGDDHDGDDYCSFESVDKQESKFTVLKKKQLTRAFTS